MTEIERLLEQLDRTWNGEAWHGPSLTAVLAGIEAPIAAARPLPAVHTVWELVGHMAAWQRAVTHRLSDRLVDPSEEENWPRAEPPTDEAWGGMLAALENARADLRARVAALSDEELDDVPGRGGETKYVLIHGAIQHDLYHAGQIVLLAREAAGR